MNGFLVSSPSFVCPSLHLFSDVSIKGSAESFVVTDTAADAPIKLLDEDGDVIQEVIGVVMEF